MRLVSKVNERISGVEFSSGKDKASLNEKGSANVVYTMSLLYTWAFLVHNEHAAIWSQYGTNLKERDIQFWGSCTI